MQLLERPSTTSAVSNSFDGIHCCFISAVLFHFVCVCVCVCLRVRSFVSIPYSIDFHETLESLPLECSQYVNLFTVRQQLCHCGRVTFSSGNDTSIKETESCLGSVIQETVKCSSCNLAFCITVSFKCEDVTFSW
jgi:hypothetical protein